MPYDNERDKLLKSLLQELQKYPVMLALLWC
jgi:hypothetical protein